MARAIYKMIDGVLTEIYNNDCKPRETPYIHTDELPQALESYATDEGRMFTSKSALRRHYKENGVEDTGGSHLTGTAYKYKSNKEEIRASVEEGLRKLKWGMAPISEKERELCKQEANLSERILRENNWKLD